MVRIKGIVLHLLRIDILITISLSEIQHTSTLYPMVNQFLRGRYMYTCIYKSIVSRLGFLLPVNCGMLLAQHSTPTEGSRIDTWIRQNQLFTSVLISLHIIMKLHFRKEVARAHYY